MNRIRLIILIFLVSFSSSHLTSAVPCVEAVVRVFRGQKASAVIVRANLERLQKLRMNSINPNGFLAPGLSDVNQAIALLLFLSPDLEGLAFQKIATEERFAWPKNPWVRPETWLFQIKKDLLGPAVGYWSRQTPTGYVTERLLHSKWRRSIENRIQLLLDGRILVLNRSLPDDDRVRDLGRIRNWARFRWTLGSAMSVFATVSTVSVGLVEYHRNHELNVEIQKVESQNRSLEESVERGSSALDRLEGR